MTAYTVDHKSNALHVVPPTMFLGCPIVPFIRSSGRLLLPYLMNGSNNFDETYREQPLAPTDDLVRFWRSWVIG